MKKLAVALLAALPLSFYAAPAAAQAPPRAELFGGYSYLSYESPDGSDDEAHGVEADYTYYLDGRWGFVVSASAHWGTQSVAFGSVLNGLDVQQTAFLGGVRAKVYTSNRAAVGLAALVGVTRREIDTAIGGVGFGDDTELSYGAMANEDKAGYPPYHPVMMTKLLLYGYAVGVRSARKLQQATRENVGFRVLCAGNEPDFRTIAAFRARHLEAMEGLFQQVLTICAQAGMAKLGYVAVDGTKIKANASKHKAMSYGRMKRERKRLRTEIRTYLQECVALDEAEDARYGADKRGDELPEELADPAKRLDAIERAMAALEQQATEKAEQKGKEPSKPKDNAQYNFTDPDSRIMKSADRAYIQAYNAQAAVDEQHQIVVAAEVTQQANDKGWLVPMVHQVVDRLELVPEQVSADAGYWVERDVERLEWYDIEALVAPKKLRHSDWRKPPTAEGPPPEGLTTKQRMEHVLNTEEGRRKMMRRWVTVEPVFGQIKRAMGFREFSMRGTGKAQGEWKLVCTAHNLLKLFRNGVSMAPRPSGELLHSAAAA